MSILRNRRGAAALAALLTGTAAGAVAVLGSTASADTGAACAAAYAVSWQTPSDNPPDFGATVTVTNNSPYPITTWTVTLTYPAGQAVIAGSPYSANVTQAGATVTGTLRHFVTVTSSGTQTFTRLHTVVGTISVTVYGTLQWTV